MKIIKKEIQFTRYNNAAMIASVLIILVILTSLIVRGGLNYGIDFKGGGLIQLKFTNDINISDVRDNLASVIDGDSSVQRFGDEGNTFIVNVELAEAEINPQEKLDKIANKVVSVYKDKVVIERTEMVGPKIGSDLKVKAILATTYLLGAIIIYITIRFGFFYAIAAIITLLHDAILTVGSFSLADKEITIAVIAAILTVLGYSLNDTIIIFDRMRENIKLKKGINFKTLTNQAINQTLSRTILTSGTTLFVVISLFLFGGPVIHDFSFALLVGVIVGTYSSVFISAASVILYEKYGKRLILQS